MMIEFNKEGILGHGFSSGHMHVPDHAVGVRPKLILHLHGLKHQKALTCCDHISRLDADTEHQAGHRSAQAACAAATALSSAILFQEQGLGVLDLYGDLCTINADHKRGTVAAQHDIIAALVHEQAVMIFADLFHGSRNRFSVYKDALALQAYAEDMAISGDLEFLRRCLHGLNLNGQGEYTSGPEHRRATRRKLQQIEQTMRGSKRVGVLAVLLIGSAWISQAQPGTPASSEALFARVMADARQSSLHAASLGTIMRTVGLQFEGKPYAAGLLNTGPEGELMVDLTQFDCVLYLEVVLAMALGIATEDYDFDTFRARLKALRYRDGQMDGYCSLLHYFSEWIINNEAHGFLQNITQAVGGIPLEKTLNYMSTHRESYPRMAENDSLYRGILAMERDLADVALYHIPQAQIRRAYPLLRDGDILAMSTHIKGLDVAHTGLAFAQPDGTFGLLHASSSGGVMVSPDLATYVLDNKAQIGIIVARPTDPRPGR